MALRKPEPALYAIRPAETGDLDEIARTLDFLGVVLREQGELWWKVYARGKRAVTLNLADARGHPRQGRAPLQGPAARGPQNQYPFELAAHTRREAARLPCRPGRP